MTLRSNRFLYWTPRVLSILFIGFVSLFALDVFDEHLPFWRTVLALLIHLRPAAIMTVILLVSWRWDWVGGAAFIALALMYIEQMGGVSRAYTVIYGPAFLIGVLFSLNWIHQRMHLKLHI